ncbi:hypothetical protein [Rhizobium sp. Leaf341]|uniref:hypothetical protein n=1 Tax=Rhizobium sp. Leaf341 TaxID=1736344 RepID=UPI00071270F6|nr:hypothetical protein [Rhizobium sp. Leaf341]KQR76033.1 hypothetical protein ASG03_20605 [Rhizobium sp. Leaf341]
MKTRTIIRLLACNVLLSATLCHPLVAWADKGGGHGGGGHGSGDHGGGGGGQGHGSDGDHGGGSGSGSDDRGGSSGDRSGGSNSGQGHGTETDENDGRKDDNDSGKPDKGAGRRGDESRFYTGGWREQIRNGRYEVFDPAGRLVIRREAVPADYLRF